MGSIRSQVKKVFDLLNHPLKYLPQYGKNAEANFLGVALCAQIGSVIIFVLWFLTHGFSVAWEKARLVIVVAAVAYAIGAHFRAIRIRT